MAVETNYFPLWEAEQEKFRFTYRPAHPRPVKDFTKMMGRFSHLNEDESAQLQAQTDARIELLERLVGKC